MKDLLNECRSVQGVAKQVLAGLGDGIGPDSSEQSIAALAIDSLSRLGITETWYYDCPALVLAGNRSCLSMSGRDYRPAEEPLGSENLVTVDLSPCIGNIWGDCARSFAIEDGRCLAEPSRPEFRRGFDAQSRLHADMKRFVSPDNSFRELFEFANDMIQSLGYVNLDLHGNVGHSIARARDDRIYIAANNRQKLASVRFFTFEPHICEFKGKWGFKHENIYFFDDNGDLQEL